MISSEGHQIVLCLDMRYLKCSMHPISPQMHCHQSPKPLRDKYALTPALDSPGPIEATSGFVADGLVLSAAMGERGKSSSVANDQVDDLSELLTLHEEDDDNFGLRR